MTVSGSSFGHYRILEPLGEGAMAYVFKARNPLGRTVALKLLREPQNELAAERFRREAQVTAALSHSGIVQVLEAGVEDGRGFISYELVEGRDLEDLITVGDQAQLLTAVQAVAEAVGHAHQQGVVHRDLKPANVLIDAEGRPRVADFGLALCAGVERLTQSGALVGTPHYMAPEQMRGERESYGPPVDVWALGVILYEVLTGELPFEGESLVEILAKVLHGRAIPPRSLDPSVSPAIEAVCLRALAREPEERFPDGTAFAEALANALADPSSTPRASPAPLIAGALILLAAGASGVVWARSPPRPKPTPTATPNPTRETARRSRELEDALRELREGSLLVARAQLTRLAPRPEELRSTRASLVRSAQAEGQTLAQTRALLDRLAALATFLPPAERGREESPLLSALLAQILQEGALSEAHEQALRRLVSCGARFSTRNEGLDLLTSITSSRVVSGTSAAAIRRQTILAIKLDASISCFSKKELETNLGQSTDGTGPWADYFHLLTRRRDEQREQRFKSLLLSPPAGFVLGPVQWSDSVTNHSKSVTPQAALPLLERALKRDPTSVSTAAAWTTRNAQLGNKAEVIEGAARCLDLMHRQDYLERITTRGKYYFRANTIVKDLARAGARKPALELFAQIKNQLSPDQLSGTLKSWPWLAD